MDYLDAVVNGAPLRVPIRDEEAERCAEMQVPLNQLAVSPRTYRHMAVIFHSPSRRVLWYWVPPREWIESHAQCDNPTHPHP